MELSLYVEKLDPAVIFQSGGTDSVLAYIHNEVGGFVPDLTTKEGRDEIKSLSHQVSKSKVVIESLAKTLTVKLNAQLKPIHSERKKCVDDLDDLRDSIRKPLTDWEDAKKAETKRVALELEISGCIEVADLMNDKFDRDQADNLAKAALLEQETKDAEIEAQEKHDSEIRNEAVREAQERFKTMRDSEVKPSVVQRDDTHKARVNNLILQKFVSAGLSEFTAKKIILEIHRGEWPHVSITY